MAGRGPSRGPGKARGKNVPGAVGGTPGSTGVGPGGTSRGKPGGKAPPSKGQPTVSAVSGTPGSTGIDGNRARSKTRRTKLSREEQFAKGTTKDLSFASDSRTFHRAIEF